MCECVYVYMLTCVSECVCMCVCAPPLGLSEQTFYRVSCGLGVAHTTSSRCQQTHHNLRSSVARGELFLSSTTKLGICEHKSDKV